MEADEAQTLYNQITQYLRERRPADAPPDVDLLAEIEAEIEAGKAVPVKLRVARDETIADPVAGDRAASTRASGEFIERRPYSPQERLSILIESLALAAAGPPLMAERIAAVTSDGDAEGQEGTEPATREIVLARDERAEPERIVQPGALPDQVGSARLLLELLDEVRTELRKSSRRSKLETA